MAELKKCPFCGGEAIKVAFCWAHISDESTIECTVCGNRTKVLKSEEAIEAWNNRVTEAEIRNKAIDDFAERIKNANETEGIEELTVYGRNRMVDMIAERLKGGADSEKND